MGEIHTKRKKIHAVQYLLGKKLSPWILHWLCISHPKPWGGQRAGACVVSSSEMAGGKKKRKNSQQHACVCVCFGGEEINVWLWGGGLIFQRHSEKTGSSFQTPVQAKEWVSSVEESDRVESSVFCCFLFFKYSIVRKSPHLLSLSPIWCYLCQQAGWFMVMEGRWWGEGAQWPFPRPPHHSPCDRRTAGKSRKQLLTEAPRKAASQKKALQNQN